MTALAALLVLLAQSPPAAASPEAAVTLRWKEKTTGVHGFVVTRSERRAGPYLRVNGALVKSAEGPTSATRSYVWVDHDVRPGRTYYYALIAVLESGTKQRVPGVVTKKVESAAPVSPP